MISVGDYVFDIVNNDVVQVLEIHNVWGYLTYTVFNKTNNIVYKLSENQTSLNFENNYLWNINYIRYISLLARIRNEISTGLISKLSNKIIPLPHQIYAVNRVLSSNNIRYIL